MTDDEVAARIAALPEQVNQNAALVRRGRFLTTCFVTGTPALPAHVTVRHGRIERVETGPALMRSWSFALRAEPEAWTRFWQPVPQPGWHDLLALSRYGRLVIEGDLQPLMANLRYVKEVLAIPRGTLAGAST
ncbi:MAG: hypothetical protein VW644_00465 [Alphaproteobacteria bacterium]